MKDPSTYGNFPEKHALKNSASQHGIDLSWLAEDINLGRLWIFQMYAYLNVGRQELVGGFKIGMFQNMAFSRHLVFSQRNYVVAPVPSR